MTRYLHGGRGIEAAVILILLCTVLAGCPPRKPTPVVVSATAQPDSSHAQDHQERR